MTAAIFGLLGTLLGGIITIVGTYLNKKKDLELKMLEFEAQRAQAQLAEKTKDRDRQLEKYASFLGAYRKVHGSVVDIVMLLREQPGEWRDAIVEILDSSYFAEAIRQLNEGTAWVGLLSHQEHAAEQASRLTDAYNSLIEELTRTAKRIVAGEAAVPLENCEAKLRETDSYFDELFKTLRKEILISR